MNKFTDFIRKNIILVVVIVAGLIATVVLGCMWYSAYDAVSVADAEIRKYVKESDLIHAKKNPVAVKASEVIISQNTQRLNDKIKESQRHFGFPYRKAFKQCFIQKLNEPFSIAAENEKDSEALKAGLKKITYTEDDVLQIFKRIYNGYYESNNKHADTSDLDNLIKERENIYNTFRMAVIAPREEDNLTDDEKIRYIAKAGEVYDNAVAEFMKRIQPDTLEQVDENDVKHILMDAMGLPRMMSNLACKAYIEEIRNNILHNAKTAEYLEEARREKNAARIAELEKVLAAPELIPGMRQYVEANKTTDTASQSRYGGDVNQNHKTPEQKVDALVYENPANQLPPSGNIVHILNHYKIVEDVYNRMRSSGIRAVDKFDRSTPLNGVTFDMPFLRNVAPGKRSPGHIRYYEYTVVVESTLSEIQKFVNNLHDAYSDYRIYAIQSVSIENQEKSINAASAKLKTAESEIKGKQQGNYNEADSAVQETESEKMRLNRCFSNDLYGKTLLGQNTVTAKISFRYLVYTGDQLETMR